MRNRLNLANAVALLVPAVLILGALGSQYMGGLYPCEMCMWQRWPHYAAILIALVAFVLPAGPLRRPLVVLAGLAILVSGAIGVFHAGVEYHWWQGITGCATEVNKPKSIDELLKSVMAAPVIRCDVPQWTMFGISLAGFNAIISTVGGVAVLVLALKRDRAG